MRVGLRRKGALGSRRSHHDGGVAGSLAEAAALQRAGKRRLAAIRYRKILDEAPDNADALHALGMLKAGEGRMREALALLTRAVAIRQDAAGFLYNLGNVLMAMGQHDQAEQRYRQAIAAKSDYAEAFVHLGNCLLTQQRAEEAIGCFRRALALKSHLTPACLGLGNAYRQLDDFEQAVGCYQAALALEPSYAEAHNNLGSIYRLKGDLVQALEHLERAVTLARRTDFEAVGNLINLLLYICAWDRLTELTSDLKRGGKLPKKALTPFTQIARSDDPADAFAVAQLWSCPPAPPIRLEPVASTLEATDGRITVAYLSSDFRDHPVSHLLAPVFALHDRECFRVLAISHGPDDSSAVRRRIAGDADSFIDIRGISNHDSAVRIATEKVDILVDLNGLTSDNSLAICASRPAPIQVEYLGFAGTTGAAFMDYIITDEVVSPPSHAPYFTENFAYMPDCFMISEHPAVSASPGSRRDHGLPDDAVVFASFNQSYKIDRTTFAAWMGILAEIEGSVLWLPDMNTLAQENLRKVCVSSGVDPSRIVFSKRVSDRSGHLARLRHADLALDTRLYNGHSTTLDALWVGLPVVTLEGRHFASRVSTSLLNAAGLSELVTRTPDEYKSLVVSLARDPGARRAIRDRLVASQATAAIFDTRQMLRSLEALYRQMHARARAGKPPRLLRAADGIGLASVEETGRLSPSSRS